MLTPLRTKAAWSAVAIVLATVATAACGSSNQNANASNVVTTTTVFAGTVADRTANDAELSTFATLLNVSGALNAVNGDRSFTLFAPTNEPIARIAHARLRALLAPRGRGALARLVGMHIVRGNHPVLRPGDLATVNGGTLIVRKNGDTVTISDGFGHTVKVVGGPLTTKNGTVYRVDGVLAGNVPLR